MSPLVSVASGPLLQFSQTGANNSHHLPSTLAARTRSAKLNGRWMGILFLSLCWPNCWSPNARRLPPELDASRSFQLGRNANSGRYSFVESFLSTTFGPVTAAVHMHCPVAHSGHARDGTRRHPCRSRNDEELCCWSWRLQLPLDRLPI